MGKKDIQVENNIAAKASDNARAANNQRSTAEVMTQVAKNEGAKHQIKTKK